MKKAKIFENFGLKVLAVVVSIILWIAVINVSDPVINTTYSDIPVVVTGTESVAAEGKVYELESESSVDISVNAKRSIQDYLSEDNFKAVVDLENYDEDTGMVPIRIETNKYNGQIESMKSKTEYAAVNIEDMLRKQFVITPIVSGDPEEGYVVGNVGTAENIVRVSGAQSVVSSIKKVTAELYVTGLNSDVNTSVDLKLYDAKGEQVKTANLTMNISTVAMSAQILAKKELPLRFSAGGVPKEGYSISGELTSNADTVVIAGKPASIANLSVFDVPAAAVSIEGADKNVTVEVDLTNYLPEGIILVDSENTKMVAVEVPIEEVVTKEFEIDKAGIAVTGLPEQFELKYTGQDDKVFVEVEGVSSKIKGIALSDVQLAMNLTKYQKDQNLDELKEGVYRIPLTVTLPEGITLTGAVTVPVRLSEKE